MKASPKVAVIGLDCAAPQLVFDRWRDELPHLKSLMEGGIYGELESVHPPITVPAWAAMMSGKDPGELGFYGFRNRRDYSYTGYALANSRTIDHELLWDILSRQGRRVILLGVPQTYPPKPINGWMVTCFLTPSTQSPYTYPEELKGEVEQVVPGYVLDVEGFRTEDKGALLERIYEKTQKHFHLARHLLTTRPWDFFMMVEMGIDRIQHAFWKYMDAAHPKHEPNHPYAEAIREYYIYCDRRIGELLSLFPEETTVVVVSDHGAKPMLGGICFNEWLIRKGYLVLKAYPQRPTPIDQVEIDWARTRAWGDGGYYGRLFLNVRGREPHGTIEPLDYERVRGDLITEIEAIEGPDGRRIGSKAYRPQDLYRECRGVPPDLLVYFGDLNWRSVGTVGLGEIYTLENDTGPDDANHARNGLFVLSSLRKRGRGKGKRLEGMRLLDVMPTILQQLGLAVPPGISGKPLAAGRMERWQNFLWTR